MTTYTTDGDLCAGHPQDYETAMPQNRLPVYKSGTAWEMNKNIPAYCGPCAF